MILTLIGIGVLLFGIVGAITYFNVMKKGVSRKLEDILEHWLEMPSCVAIVFGSIYLIICLTLILISHCTATTDIYNNTLTYKSIIKQIECVNSDNEDVSKTIVIQNVNEWNKNVHKAKYWQANKWTSWFLSKEVADSLQYIELEN